MPGLGPSDDSQLIHYYQDFSLYPPRIQQVQFKVFKAVPALTDPAADVRSLGEDPNEVKFIIASHAHWDHMFPAGAFLPNAKVLCGAGTFEFAKASWPGKPEGTFDARIWDQKNAELPIEEFPSPDAAPQNWQRLGPYKNAHDFFGDGSFWILDAPGHCLGNLAALARVKSRSGRTKWVFLGGDCFHCSHFVYYPEAPFGKGVKVTPTDTFHEDEEGARNFIRDTAELKKGEGEDALIWIAHTDTLEGVWEVDYGLLRHGSASSKGSKMSNGV